MNFYPYGKVGGGGGQGLKGFSHTEGSMSHSIYLELVSDFT